MTIRHLVTFHRWLGIVLCLLFAAWFASGAVMIYMPFPALPDSQRIARLAAIDPKTIDISPAEAVAAVAAPAIDRLRLISEHGTPLYVVHTKGNGVAVVNGKSGALQPLLEPAAAQNVAAQFAGMPAAAIEGPILRDQWVVDEAFDPYRPFYRARLGDDQGTVLYISARSGEVMQKTTRSQRVWNYVGAVTHWLYPTILRQHWQAWDQTVWWLSLIGSLIAVSGLWLGIVRMRASLRARRRRVSPFRGWLRWHHILGLSVGIFVLTWVASGWLSMDHGRLFPLPTPTESHVDRFRGAPLLDAANMVSLKNVQDLTPFQEAEIAVIDGMPVIVTRSSEGQFVHRLGVGVSAEAVRVLPEAVIEAAVRRAWPDFTIKELIHPGPRDPYGQLRAEQLPPTAVRLILDDPRRTWVHVDAATGRIISVMDRQRRLYRWLFNGLHSFDFPMLAQRRPLWDAVILLFLTLGFAFSLTGAVIGWRRLRAVAQARRRANAAP